MSSDAAAHHKKLYDRRRNYARRHNLQPSSYWDLPDEAEMTFAELCTHIPHASNQEPAGPGQYLAHCGKWHLLTALPFICPLCHIRLLEDIPHAS